MRFSVFTAQVRNGKFYESRSLFQPFDSISQEDGDTFIFFLSGNGVVFLEPTAEDWYRTAHDSINIAMSVGNETYNQQYYVPEEPASPLACTEKYQFCRTTSGDNRECGPLASFHDAIGGAASLFNSSYDKVTTYQMDNVTTSLEAQWLYFNAIFIRTPRFLEDIIGRLGATVLQSQRTLITGIQGPLEKDQWQLDVIHWWDISKAATQAGFINAVYGPTDPDILLTRANFTAQLEALCESQVCNSPLNFYFHSLKYVSEYYEAQVRC